MKEVTKEYNPNIKLKDVQREWINKALIKEPNVTKCAGLLGISRATLYRKANKLGIDIKKDSTNYN